MHTKEDLTLELATYVHIHSLSNGPIIFVLLYIDDMLIACKNKLQARKATCISPRTRTLFPLLCTLLTCTQNRQERYYKK